MTTAACVLISRDKGATWKASGDIEDTRTWLVNPTIEEGSKGQLIMLFRSAAGEGQLWRGSAWVPIELGFVPVSLFCLPTGKAYIATSTDRGVTWSRPYSNPLPNPNAPFSTVTIDGQVLCAFNNSQTKRAPLALALSVNDCKSWEPLAMVEEDVNGGLSKCSTDTGAGSSAF
jgi:hypothetical protein